MRLPAFLAFGLLLAIVASAAPKKEEARKEPAKPEPKSSVVIKADPRTGEPPRSGVKGADAFGRTQTRYDNGVTATTRPDPFGGTTTTFSDGTRATTRQDPFGNQVTTYSDGRQEVLRPDPFAPKKPANERK